MNKIREKLAGFFRRRYGMDELGKTLLLTAAVISMVGVFFRSNLLESLAVALTIYEFYRVMSKRHWDRNEENCVYNRYVRLWKIRFRERKTARSYLCKGCGRMVRVPKGKGRVQVTCTVCGNKSIHRS